MSTAICIAPARTLAYPQGGGHLWVYLNWALGLRSLGCRVIWLEGVAARQLRNTAATRRCVEALRDRLERYGLGGCLALWSWPDPLPPEVTDGCLDLDAAAEADLLV